MGYLNYFNIAVTASLLHKSRLHKEKQWRNQFVDTMVTYFIKYCNSTIPDSKFEGTSI